MGTFELRLKMRWVAALIAAAFLGLACQVEAASCAPAPTGLIGWWPGDGTATDVAGGNNGTLQGGASASAAGLDGTAFGFDGTNGYVQIPDSPALRPTNLTIEAWVRFSSLDSAGSGGSPAGDQYMVFKQNTRSGDFEGFDLGKTRIAGSDYFQFIVSSASGQSAHLESATAVNTGVWYHVAAVRDPSFIRLYVNGQLEVQASVAFPQDYGNFPLYFGTSGQSYWDHKLKGALDEVAIYNRALTAGEISALYSSGAAGKCKGPSMTAQPQSQSAALGTTVQFAVAATGLAPLRYQWQFNGANLANATNATLTINNIQLGDAGNYSAVVTNSLGAATSAVAVLTVLVPPAIDAQPQSRTNVVGTLATFGAAASGSGPLSFQWQFNDANIAGATDVNLTLSNVQSTDAGNYRVVVTNSVGTVTSAEAVLTIWVPPGIASQPQSRTNVLGTSAGFNVAATGTAPLSYQWQFNGAIIGGATGTSLTLGNVQVSDAGSYAVVVTNAAGSVTSAVALLTVLVPPTVITQPQNRTNVSGSLAGFSVEAMGTAPLSYQWQFNGANIGGATAATVTFGNVQASDAGNYSAVVTNTGGSITSAVAVLTVWVPPTIASQPHSRTNVVGTIAVFNVSATGTAPLSYQWQFNGANIGGATAATLTFGNVQVSDAGSYWVVVTNAAGSATSAVALLTVLVPPAIITQPQNRTNVAGTLAGFSLEATGTAPLSYQWQFNGANILGATGTSLALSNVQASDAGNYSAVVTNAGGSMTSAVAVLTIWVPPTIASQPQSRTNVVGTSAAFSVAANGTALLSYQWQFNGLTIAEATGANFSVSNVQLSDAGNYAVIVTNSAGAITSAVALLTVLVPPAFSSQPQSRTNVVGTSAQLNAAAGGTPPLSYQWQFNGANVLGATGTSLAFSDVQVSDSGNYVAVVTNAGGSVTSAVATLTVWVPPGITLQPQSRTNVVATTGTFSVTATGTAPLSYQWQLNEVNIANGTNPTLTLTNIQAGDAGAYSVIVTNVAGTATSAVAILTVLTPPSMATQPQNCTNVSGTAAAFSASVTGTAPLNYQWQFNGSNIAGANDSTLKLQNVQVTNAGSYVLMVTNLAGAATSAVATLTVLLPPTLTVQPRSHTNVAYITAAFIAGATGTTPITYQWQFNGENIAGASASTLILNNPQSLDSGNYAVVVTNVAGVATSSVATLTVIQPTECVIPPPALSGWWPGEGNANDIAGTNNGILEGGATGSVPGLSGFGFGLDGVSAFVQIPDAPALKPTNLTVMCWVRFDALDSPGNTPSGQQFIVFKQNSRATNFEGFLLSKERQVTGDVFSWTVTSAAGQSARIETSEAIVPGVWYHVAAVRGPDFLQLYLNGQLAGTTGVSFPQDYGSFPLYFGSSGQPAFDRKLAGTLDEVCLFGRPLSASEISADYFSGLAGKCKAPKIVTQPQTATGYWGGGIAFTSAAAGALPLRYQWRKDGLNLLSATNSFLTLSNLQFSDAGSYAMQATNTFGGASSDSALLSVHVADVTIRQSSIAGTQNYAGLTISGVTGKLYGIQVSSSLGASNHWTGLTNITLGTPTVTWFDPQSATQAQRYYRIVPGPIAVSEGTWETDDIGAVWSDDFNRTALGANWIVLGNAAVSVTNNELKFAQTNTVYSRQIYYQPWLTSSDEWTIRWTERFGALDATSFGVGVGIKNFQAAGGNDRGYNALLVGTGSDLGKMQTMRFDGVSQQLAAPANAMALAAGDVIDCSLTRSAWTITATASNRANAQISTSKVVFSDPANLIAPTISRICFYPLGGAVYVDNISFAINHRRPARFIVIGASASDGYNATTAARTYVSVVQSNFFEAVCNDSSSFNTTTNSISILPEILAHRPSTAILMIGGNDLAFGYPPSQWQTQYSNLVAQLQASGVAIKHTFQTPRNSVDLTPLKNWVLAHYPPGDIIDTWAPFVTNAYSLKPIYDSGDGIHPNDVGHLLLGQIIRTNLP